MRVQAGLYNGCTVQDLGCTLYRFCTSSVQLGGLCKLLESGFFLVFLGYKVQKYRENEIQR